MPIVLKLVLKLLLVLLLLVVVLMSLRAELLSPCVDSRKAWTAGPE